MVMDGIMKQNSKNFNIRLLMIPLLVFLIVKLLWVIVEFLWLPSSGVDYIANKDIKALYYRVKMAHKESKKRSKPTIKKPVSSIKDIKLLGIYTSDDYAVITVMYKGKTKVLATGDQINGFTLIGATMQYAILNKKDKNYKLELPKHISNTKSSISIVKEEKQKSLDNDTAVSGDGDYKIIDKKIFDHFANNIDDIYKNIGIQDITKGDKKIFKISFIKRGSIFSKLGLKRGDIIKSVNGEDIDSYSKAFGMYRSMKDIQNLTIVVIRNNKEVELEYEIE
jgi:general secretion pathway protein C